MMVQCGSVAVTQLKSSLTGAAPGVLIVIVNTVVSDVEAKRLQVLVPAGTVTVGFDPTSRASVALAVWFVTVRLAAPAGPVAFA